jgi:Xaa-Pro aminopeptidase
MLCLNLKDEKVFGMGKKVTDILRKANADGILLFSGDPVRGTDPNFLYYSGTKIDNSIFLGTRKESILFTSEMNYGHAKKTSPLPVVLIQRGKEYEKIKGYLKGMRVGIDMDSISANGFIRLKKRLHKKFVHVGDELRRMRGIKDEGEIAVIKRAVGITKKIFGDIDLNEKKTEAEVANELLSRTLDYGCRPAFDPIVASAERTAFPHWRPADKKLKGTVTIDYGVRYKDYCADITRCFFLGASKEEKDLYDKVKGVFGDIVDSLPSFEYVKDVADAYKMLNKKYGLPKPIHSVGHGIGLEVHEHPKINSKSKEKLKENMVFTIEPGAYLGKFGARYEDVIVHRKRKAFVL